MKKEIRNRCVDCGRIIGYKEFERDEIISIYDIDPYYLDEIIHFVHRECDERSRRKIEET